MAASVGRLSWARFFLKLDRRVIFVQYRFYSEDQDVIHRSGPGATPINPTDKWAHAIRVYDTPALIIVVWIFNPEKMAIERIQGGKVKCEELAPLS